MLTDGFHKVPAGHTAAVITFLEMHARPEARPEAALDLELERVERPTAAWYRDLFRKVGGDYLWFGRLELDDDALEAILRDPDAHVYVVRDGARDVGLLELDFRQGGDCELAYFGLAQDYVGGGAGRWLMNRAIALAWDAGIVRFHVHTCTLDHPGALAFYQRSGFVPYAREVEIAEDPRLRGLLPEQAAPQVPIIR